MPVPSLPTRSPPRPTSVLILHGWQNHRPTGHWQHALAEDLRADGVDLRYPHQPDPDQPDPVVWRSWIEQEIDASGSKVLEHWGRDEARSDAADPSPTRTCGRRPTYPTTFDPTRVREPLADPPPM